MQQIAAAIEDQMPSLNREDLKMLLVKELGPCPVCRETLGRNYCRQCDEFFDFGHKPGCRNDHTHDRHRTYLSVWTVYDHPSDMPDFYVARRFEIHPGHEMATADVLTDHDICKLRDKLAAQFLIPMERAEADDPKIMEVWV